MHCLIMSSADGFVGSNTLLSPRCIDGGECQSISHAGSSAGWGNERCLPDMLASGRPSLLHYLGWSPSRVNYRGAPEPRGRGVGRRRKPRLELPYSTQNWERVKVKCSGFRKVHSTTVESSLRSVFTVLKRFTNVKSELTDLKFTICYLSLSIPG